MLVPALEHVRRGRGAHLPHAHEKRTECLGVVIQLALEEEPRARHRVVVEPKRARVKLAGRCLPTLPGLDARAAIRASKMMKAWVVTAA